MMSGSRLVRLGLGLAVGFAILFGARRADAENSTQGERLIGQNRHGKKGGRVVWFPKTGWRYAGEKRTFSVKVDRGMLVPLDEQGHPLDSKVLVGATVTATATDGTPVTYSISKMNTPPTSPGPPIVASMPSTMYYTLVTTMPGVRARHYCGRAPGIWAGQDRYPVDDDGGHQAVPVAEVWNETATQGYNDRYFTMACVGGAIAKCYRWGYRGWSPMAKARAHVQACTRMAMADYCGDGRSHTMEGTPINFYDFAQPQVHEPPGQPGPAIPTTYPSLWSGLDMQFETAWTGEPNVGAKRDPRSWHCRTNHGGPECVPRLEEWTTPASVGGALCLSKKRWDGIEVGGNETLGKCPQLRDPRTTMTTWPQRDPSNQRCVKGQPPRSPAFQPGQFCDYYADGEVDHGQLAANGALLFNGSSYLDSLLWVWTAPNDGDRWTSVGTIGNASQKPSPPPGYQPPSDPLGSILDDSTPLSVRERLPRLVPLYSYFDSATGDHLTSTREQPPSGYGGGDVVGLIHPCRPTRPGPRGAITLYRYISNGQNDHITTTQKPSAASGTAIYCASSSTAPTSDVVIEGYLPKMR